MWQLSNMQLKTDLETAGGAAYDLNLHDLL